MWCVLVRVEVVVEVVQHLAQHIEWVAEAEVVVPLFQNFI
jgi:hypothetical protein